MAVTLKDGLKNPEIIKQLLEDDLSMAKIGAKLKFASIATFDDTLVGQPGDRINVTAYNYIGAAEDGTENGEITVATLTQTEKLSPVIKKLVKGTAITDEAIMTAHGDPLSEASKQITLAFQDKLDASIQEELAKAPLVTAEAPVLEADVLALPKIGYESLLEATGLFCDEEDGQYTIFIHPNQKVDVLSQPTFEKANALKDSLLLNGYIGSMAGVDFVMSRRVKKVVIDGAAYFENYIVKPEAVKVLQKRDVFVEPKREAEFKRTALFADSHYVAYLEFADRVVKCLFQAGFTAAIPSRIVMDGAITGYNTNDATPVKLPKMAQ